MRDEARLKGLLASAGKALARLPAERYEAAVEGLKRARSGNDLAAALAGLDLGVAEEATATLRATADSQEWDDARWRLVRAAEHHRVERMNPSS